MTYYYFIEGSDKVFERSEYICDGDPIHNQYRELSNVELEWYLEHPGASAHEVKQLCTDEELAARNLPPLEDYKVSLYNQLSELVRQRISQLIPDETLTDAMYDQIAGPTLLPTDGDRRVCDDILNYYVNIRKAAKAERNRVMLLINASETHQEADKAFFENQINSIK